MNKCGSIDTRQGQIRGEGPNAHQPFKGQTFVLYEETRNGSEKNQKKKQGADEKRNREQIRKETMEVFGSLAGNDKEKTKKNRFRIW